jgi:TolB-like protein
MVPETRKRHPQNKTLTFINLCYERRKIDCRQLTPSRKSTYLLKGRKLEATSKVQALAHLIKL